MVKSDLQARSYSLFLSAIKSKETMKIYKYHLERFLTWNKDCRDYDDLLKADDKSIQTKLENYVMYLREKFSPNYIPTIFKPVELFYVMNKVNINSKLLHKMFPETIKKGGYGAYSREMIQTMLENTLKLRTRSLILFFASSGCRVGVIPELKLGHITNYEDCKRVVCYADSKDEYVTFMTPEASKAFDEYLEERQNDKERLTSDSPAFRQKYYLGSNPALGMGIETVRSSISLSMKNVSKIKKGNRFNIPTVHGFRKYFNIVLKQRQESNISLCEKLMGHSVLVPLDNAYAPFEDTKLFEEYKKVIPELTISNEERLRIEIKQQKEEVDSSQQMKKEISDMKERFASLEDILKKLSEKD
ncbi:MAG: site-specific integrase [Thaumarchaeota archaeon]|nr:site-specific integrase [Nitrososphaerota archaeon]